MKIWMPRTGYGARFACLLAAALLSFISGANAQVMTDQNSSAAVNPTTQAGMFNWTVDGVNQLAQQWFWYALGPAGASTAPHSIDTLGLTQDAQPTANTLQLGYLGAGFTMSVGYTLTGGNPGSGLSDMGESIRINNTTHSALAFQFYEYSDFDLGGVPGPATAQIFGNPAIGFNTAYQTAGPLTLSETVVTPAATFAEAGPEFVTLAKLNNGVAPVVLNNNLVAAGNVTWAFQWNLLIPAGGSALISKDKYLQTTVVPEPAALTLVAASLGLVGFAFGRRRKAA